MSQNQPLNLFALSRNPALAREVIQRHYPSAKFDAPGAEWTKAEVSEKGLLRSKPVVSFNHDTSYYADPGWGEQLEGMAGYFSQCEANDRQQMIIAQVIPKFTFSISCIYHREPGDKDMRFLSDLSSSLKGFIFDGAQLLDANGRCALDTDGYSDPEASFPQEFYTPPPTAPVTAALAAGRAVAVAAVVMRALLERDLANIEDPGNQQKRLLEWMEVSGAVNHLEPEEAEIIAAAPGSLTPQQNIDAMWQAEGLEVLLWALGRHTISPLHVLSNIDTPLDLCGVFRDDAVSRLEAGELRPAAELELQQAVQLALHWRMAEYRLRPGRMDFPGFVERATFGPLSLAGVPLVDGDLALGADALHSAPENVRSIATSMASERHRAINWLLRGGSWVHTDTAT